MFFRIVIAPPAGRDLPKRLAEVVGGGSFVLRVPPVPQERCADHHAPAFLHGHGPYGHGLLKRTPASRRKGSPTRQSDPPEGLRVLILETELADEIVPSPAQRIQIGRLEGVPACLLIGHLRDRRESIGCVHRNGGGSRERQGVEPLPQHLAAVHDVLRTRGDVGSLALQLCHPRAQRPGEVIPRPGRSGNGSRRTDPQIEQQQQQHCWNPG